MPVLLLLIATACAGIVAAESPRIDGLEVHYQAEVAALEAAATAKPIPAGGILFVGSSIWRLYDRLAERMDPLPVANRAFGGSRTWEQLAYFDRVVLPLRPRLIVYYCGSNDILVGEPADRIADRFERFSARVGEVLPGTAIIYASVLRAPGKRAHWDVVDGINQRIRIFAAGHPAVEFVDLNPAVADITGEPLAGLYLDDGIHYRPEAYERFTAILKPLIQARWAALASDGR